MNARPDADRRSAHSAAATGAATPAASAHDADLKADPPTRAADIASDSTPSKGAAPSAAFEGTTGIVERRYGGGGVVTQTGARTGRQEGYDRIVFEFAGNRLPGYHVEYVDGPVRHCGSGAVARVEGAKRLLVRMMPARAHDDAGNATFAHQDPAPGMAVIRSARLICDYEAQVEWAIGVDHASGYRVLELREPTRLVIDILH